MGLIMCHLGAKSLVTINFLYHFLYLIEQDTHFSVKINKKIPRIYFYECGGFSTIKIRIHQILSNFIIW